MSVGCGFPLYIHTNTQIDKNLHTVHAHAHTHTHTHTHTVMPQIPDPQQLPPHPQQSFSIGQPTTEGGINYNSAITPQ